MPAVFYNLIVAVVFVTGTATLMQPQRQTRAFMQTLEEIQDAGTAYIGNHCDALPEAADQALLQESEALDEGFDDQGAAFTWRLAAHPVVSVNVTGDAAYLAFLSGHSLGGFEADGSFAFIPDHDASMFRAANHWYNLFAYAADDFSCD